MSKQQAGFTLIELVMVIVILGILGATAIPKFVDLSDEAQQATTAGVAGALGSGSAINVAVRSLGNTADSVAVANCDDLDVTLDGGLPSAGYTITSLAIAPGGTSTCTLAGPTSTSATFTGHGIS